MDLFTNPWIVGIGGGIISSLVVTIISRYFFSTRDRKEHRQRVETANNEIMYSVRPLIAEKMLPTCDILEGLLSSMARKYGLDISDVYDARNLANDLISEIMGNSFLASQQKLDFCAFVSQLKLEEVEASMRRLHSKLDADGTVRSKSDTTSDLSTMVGLTAGVTFVLVTAVSMGGGSATPFALLHGEWLAPVLSTILVSVGLTSSILLARRYRRLKSRQHKPSADQPRMDTTTSKKSDESAKLTQI